MTAFAKTDIPDSVNTLEKLIVWAANTLNYINPKTTAIEGTTAADAATIRVTQFSPYFVTAVADDPHWRVIMRQSIRLNSNWQLGTTKIWTHATEISSTVLPADFKS